MAAVARPRDRGDASVEAVIIVPVIVVLTLLVVQFVLVWHGTHVAQAAAQTAARTAAAYRADPGDRAGRRGRLPRRGRPEPAPRPHRHRDRATPTTVTAVVQAQVLTILPFAGFDIQETATAPRERFVENGRRAMTSRRRDRLTRVVSIGIVGR